MRRSGSLVLASGIGRRKENQDAIFGTAIGAGPTVLLVCCDGIGSLPDAGNCARAECKEVARRLLRHIRVKLAGRRISPRDAPEIGRVLANVHLTGVAQESGTTLAVSILDGKRLLIAWAGDSRIYALEATGQMRQLTEDHHNAEGLITRSVQGTGLIGGGIATHFEYLTRPPIALVATTDGVHDSCTIQELRKFTLFCVESRIGGNQEFSQELAAFLGNNISDNFSMALWYRAQATRRLIEIAEQDVAT